MPHREAPPWRVEHRAVGIVLPAEWIIGSEARAHPRFRGPSVGSVQCGVMPAEPALDRPRHLRARGEGEQSITFVELFFDLVYVFAVTQISHVLIEHLGFAGAGRAAFLLLVVWWAWIYTTWMVNWFDPDSPPVRIALIGVMGASLVLAAALPEAFGKHGGLFVLAYVGLQVGRNATAAALLPRGHTLRRTFERITVWSLGSGLLWVAGLLESGDRRLYWWLPALAVELLAPAVGYATPVLGRSLTSDYDIEGGHFAERCQGFIIIALGESIVVTGATAASAGLGNTVVLALVVAFLETAALWWLYFGEGAAHSRRRHRVERRRRAPRPRRLHLPAPADRRRDHRRRGRRRPADRGPEALAEPCRRDHGARRPGALPARREPLPPAHDRLGQPQARRHRRAPVRAHGGPCVTRALADPSHRGADGARRLGGQGSAAARGLSRGARLFS